MLLVDDEPFILSSFSRILRRAGFAVHGVSDGGCARDAIVHQQFDVVITDIALPGVDGIEVLQAVRESNPDLPVVLVTGVGELATAAKAVEFGAFRYLMKPVDATTLIEVTSRAVAHYRMAGMKRRALDHYRDITTLDARRTALSRCFDRARETLYMVYQPIISWTGRRIVAYEALARSEEPTLRTPQELMAAAEILDRLHDVGRAGRNVIANALHRRPASLDIFVNMHPHDLFDDELLSGASPLTAVSRRVVLEVTERAAPGPMTEDAREPMETLRSLGYRIAVDDLGAGYAGLTSIVDLRPDVMKLDMSLVRGVDQDPTKRSLIRAMVGLGAELDVPVVAEGIETTQEKVTLVGLGCDLLQGYLFGRPRRDFKFPMATASCRLLDFRRQSDSTR